MPVTVSNHRSSIHRAFTRMRGVLEPVLISEAREVTTMLDGKAIESLLAPYPAEVRELALAARDFLAEALPGAQETVDESAKLLGYGYGTGYTGLACTLLLSKKGIKLGISRGSELPDPKHLLQTTADLNQPGLKPLLKAALAAWKKRTEVNG